MLSISITAAQAASILSTARPGDAPAVAAVNGEIFADIRPASTIVTVAGLIEPSMLVEVELEARRG